MPCRTSASLGGAAFLATPAFRRIGAPRAARAADFLPAATIFLVATSSLRRLRFGFAFAFGWGFAFGFVAFFLAITPPPRSGALQRRRASFETLAGGVPTQRSVACGAPTLAPQDEESCDWHKQPFLILR